MAEHEHEAEPDSPSSMDQELAKETGKMTVLEIKEEYTYVIPSFSVISKVKKTLINQIQNRVPSGLLLPRVSLLNTITSKRPPSTKVKWFSLKKLYLYILHRHRLWVWLVTCFLSYLLWDHPINWSGTSSGGGVGHAHVQALRNLT